MNEKVIVPNTSGVLTFASKEINDIEKTSTIEGIKTVTEVFKIIEGRVNNIPLAELVDPARIVSQQARKEVEIQNEKKEETAWWREE